LITITVISTPSRYWRVEFGGADRNVEFPEKQSAVAHAIEWAKSHPPCHVLVCAYGGVVERSLDYPTALSEYRTQLGDRRQEVAATAFPDRRLRERRR
jgi:hypothetical protein